MRVAETKVLFSFADTAKLICAFIFAWAKIWFSHDAAHLSLTKHSWCFMPRLHLAYDWLAMIVQCQSIFVWSPQGDPTISLLFNGFLDRRSLYDFVIVCTFTNF